MFTGIVEACGRVARIEGRPSGMRLAVDRQGWLVDPPPREGDSVCVSGVCLTVAKQNGSTLEFDVVAETLNRTTFGAIRPGDRVNLESALTPLKPMGGHFVQGHVDGVGRVMRVDRGQEQWRMTIQPGAENVPEGWTSLMDAVVPKGSVAIDGVSLTVAAVGPGGFEVALIPTTLQRTTLGQTGEGDRVNLEADIISKTVVHWLGARLGDGRAVTMDTLRGAGFVEK